MNGQTTARKRGTSRPRLLRAARTCFVEHGYDATRPQDIAREAGVAIGTFYLHFRDKEAAFLAFAEGAQDDLIGHYEANLEGVVGLEARLRVILETIVSYATDHPGVLQVAFIDPVLIAPHDEDAWRVYDRLGEFIHMVIGADMGVDDFDAKLVSHALCGFLRHATIYAGRRGLDVQTMIDNLVRFVGRALAEAPVDDPRTANERNNQNRRIEVAR